MNNKHEIWYAKQLWKGKDSREGEEAQLERMPAVATLCLLSSLRVVGFCICAPFESLAT
jgi:formate hydrogenlyase subunit 3/multisubunit Na+/H+ antiporter MnhD subunit